MSYHVWSLLHLICLPPLLTGLGANRDLWLGLSRQAILSEWPLGCVRNFTLDTDNINCLHRHNTKNAKSLNHIY